MSEKCYRLVDRPEDVRPDEEVKTLLTMTDEEFVEYVRLLEERGQEAAS
jgi:hypothetical protein